jgi:tetratricopeptide (TPR) repeat protein
MVEPGTDLQKIKQDAQKSSALFNQKLSKALPYFKKATKINPDFYPAWRQQGWIKELMLFQLTGGVFIPGLGEAKLSPEANLLAQEALAVYDKATTLNPSDSQLYFSKGGVLQRLSRHQEAIDAFTQAIKINPRARFYSSRSDSYCAMSDKQKAEADMKSAEKLGYQRSKDLPVCLELT